MPSKSDSYLSLLGAGTPDRDYEGLGGWRTQGDELEEGIWMGMNSRLELPAATPGGNGGRRHRRSLTGASQALRMSAIQSRARTPSFGREDDVGYFGQFHHGLARRKSAGNSLAESWDGKKEEHQ